MATRMPLPPGNSQIRMYDGHVYRAGRAGGSVTIDNPEHAKAINAKLGNGDAGLLDARFHVHGATGTPGRVCTVCGFRAYAWSMTCPRGSCGAPTEPEQPG